MPNLLNPYYRIYIDGKELDEFRYSMIKEIVFEDNASGSDLLKITIVDPEFIFIDDNILIEEKKIKFYGGYEHDYRHMFSGFISIVDIDFPEEGSPTLVVNCMDSTHIMNRVKKSRTWTNKTRGEVASAIFKEYGLKAVIKTNGNKQEDISQSNETDIQLLIKLADEEVDTHIVYVEDNTGYFVMKEILSSPQATLDYRDGAMNILSFSPRINKETKQVEQRSSNVNLKDKKVDKAQSNDNTSRNVAGKPVQSTDRNVVSNPSWKYENGKWVQTY